MDSKCVHRLHRVDPRWLRGDDKVAFAQEGIHGGEGQVQPVRGRKRAHQGKSNWPTAAVPRRCVAAALSLWTRDWALLGGDGVGAEPCIPTPFTHAAPQWGLQ